MLSRNFSVCSGSDTPDTASLSELYRETPGKYVTYLQEFIKLFSFCVSLSVLCACTSDFTFILSIGKNFSQIYTGDYEFQMYRIRFQLNKKIKKHTVYIN